jgi:O-antigen/teichoic acid export membrane protein
VPVRRLAPAIDSTSAQPPATPVLTNGASGRLARNISLLGAAQLLTWILTLAWTLFVPRMIGPSGMGLIVMALAASGILVGMAGLGSRPMLVKEIAADPARAPQLLGTAFIVRAVLILPCIGLTFVYVHLGGFNRAQAVALYLGVGLAAFTLLAEVIQAGLQGIERMEYLAAGEVLNKGLQALIAIPMAMLGFAATSLIGLQVAVAALLTGLNLAWARRFRIEWSLRPDRVRSFVVGSLAYWAYAVFFTFYLWVDATLLSLMTPQQVVGWYGVPTRIFQTLMFVPAILSTAWLPRLAAAYSRGPEDLKVAARTPLELVSVLSLPIAAGVVLVARPMTLLLYGPAYEASIPVLQILAVTCIPMYLNIIVNQVLTASNRQMVWTRAMILASVVNPAMNLLLISYFQHHRGNGAIGAAVSMFGTEVLIVGMGIWVIRRFIDPGMLWRLGRAMLATAGMIGVTLLAARFGLVAQIAAGAVSFALLGVLLRVISRAEFAELSRLGGRRMNLRALRRRSAA